MKPPLRTSPQTGVCVQLRVGTLLDTVGESFELNIAAAQEAETLTGTAKPIMLAQEPVRGKWNIDYSNTA
jgi:hypothetical protein